MGVKKNIPNSKAKFKGRKKSENGGLPQLEE